MDEVITLIKSHWQVIAVSAGPLTLSMMVRVFLGKNRLMIMLVRGSAAWLGVRILLTPYMDMAKENLNYLIQITHQ